MAGRIPDKFIDALLLRVDVVELIDSFVPLRKMGKDYKACCPFHDEKTPSFTVSQDKQFYHCFGCGAHGSAITFLMEYEHMGFREAVEELSGRAGLPLPQEVRESKAATVDPAPKLIEALKQASGFYQRQLREHAQAKLAVDYLKARGLSGQIAAEFGLGFAPDGWDGLLRALGNDPDTQSALHQAGLLVKKDTGGGYYDRFRSRIMFPIQDYRGRIVGFGGRILGKGEPKYLNSPETPLFHKGRELYGLYRARDSIKNEQRVVVVEGYMDVVALAQYGVNNVVATLGTATTPEHLGRLFRFAPEVVFCFDGDQAGRDAAWRALENVIPALHEGRQVSFLFLPEGEDPDSLVRKEGQEGFTRRLSEVVSLPDFLFQGLAARVNLDRLDGRAALVELAKPYMTALAAGVLRELMVRRLAELSRMEPEKLSTLLYGKEMHPQRARAMPATRGKPSLTRSAIAILVQHPQLARDIGESAGFGAAPLPGMSLLLEVLGVLQAEPGLNTAALMERFKDSEHAQTLAKLAVWDYPSVIPNVPAELADLLDHLRRLANAHAIDNLSNKQRLHSLSQTEKAELLRLLEENRQLEEKRKLRGS